MMTHAEKLTIKLLLNNAKSILEKDFGMPKTTGMVELMRLQYLRLFLATDGFESIQGKKILDIACGSRTGSPPDGVERRTDNYEPWFARFAQACGADVTGMDRRASAPENYRHMRVDLTNQNDPNGLATLPDESFDIINTSGFLSPRASKNSSAIDMTDPAINERHTNKQLHDLYVKMTAQVARILCENGFYFENERMYQKKSGVLVEVSASDLLDEVGSPVYPD